MLLEGTRDLSTMWKIIACTHGNALLFSMVVKSLMHQASSHSAYPVEHTVLPVLPTVLLLPEMQPTDVPFLAVIAGTPALELVRAQATTPMDQAPMPATAAAARTAQTTRQQAQWVLATKLAQALAQAMIGTTPMVTPTAQVAASRAMFQARLNTRPVMPRAPAQAQAMTGTTPPLALAVATAVARLAQAVATAVARLAVVPGMAVATLDQGMTGTTPPLAVVEA